MPESSAPVGNLDPTFRRRWYREGYYGAQTLATRISDLAASRPRTRLTFVSDERPGVSDLGTADARARRLAAGLARYGVRPGDRVAVQVPNSLEGLLTMHALWYLGVVVVPVVHIYGPDELGFILRQSGARALVVPDRWGRIDFLERVAALGDVPSLETVVVVGDEVPDGMVRWSDLEVTEALDEFPANDPDAPCLILYTSGTSAEPKGVAHTHNTLLAELRWSTMVITAGASPVKLSTFPAGHAASLLELLRATVGGMATVWMDRWDPDHAAALVEQYRATCSTGAQVHLGSLVEAARGAHRDLSSLQAFMCGASSVSPGIIESAEELGIRAFRGYGSSEHPVLSVGSPSEALSLRAGTDGTIAPGSEIRLVDPSGDDVLPGSEGELVCRGPQQFVGYTDQTLNEGAYLDGGWFRTGDVALIGEANHLVITDRIKDVIIRGGETMSSKAIEDVLTALPAIAEAAVVGAPDDRLGERVCAFIVVAPGQQVELPDIARHFAEAGVARQKTPERLEIVQELPRNSGGKVVKAQLRQLLG